MSRLWIAVLAAFGVFLLGPLVLVVLFSVNDAAHVGFPMTGLSGRWYAALWAEPEFWAALCNALVIAVPVAVLSTVTGTLAAFASLHRPNRRGPGLLAVLALPAMVPPLVVAIGLVVLWVRVLGAPLGVPVVILGHVLLTQPFVALILAARLASFDRTAIEAARDLGATEAQIFLRVTLPQIASAIVGAALIAFALSLDEFVVTLFTIGSGNTLSTFVWGKMRTALDPSINAIATLVLLLTTVSAAIGMWAARYRG